MGPLIDQELERIDRRHAELTKLGSELMEALNMYHNLMREPVMNSQYNDMRMGIGMPGGGPASMPGFPNSSMGHYPVPGGYQHFDPNGPQYANGMMRGPPHSAPAAPDQYNQGPYQSMPPHGQQNNGPPQNIVSPTHGQPSNQNSMNIPNIMQHPNHQVSNQNPQVPNPGMEMWNSNSISNIGSGMHQVPGHHVPQMVMSPPGPVINNAAPQFNQSH